MFDVLLEGLQNFWSLIAGALTVLLAVIASSHAVVYKRDDRAALGWVGVIWLVPIGGPLLYVLFGINRIRRRAILMRADTAQFMTGEFPASRDEKLLNSLLGEDNRHIAPLSRLVDSVARRTITYNNSVVPLRNGEEAYPEMLASINRAEKSIGLSTFIFDNDITGRKFCEALARAVHRGVAVRVLIDAVGSRYSWPSIIRELKRAKVPFARFAPSLLPWRLPYVNLRNHRKILVVDGSDGYAGGMNIRDRHVLVNRPRRPIRDLHFRINGPVVAHLSTTFAEDWVFSTKEELTGPVWFTEPNGQGTMAARGLTDGPDEDFEKLRWTIHGALACAQRSVKVVTPYFLPDAALITALGIAAMRGVKVQIVLPQKNNQILVQWASHARLWQLINRGCEIYFSPPPFDHTKMMLVDGVWALIGSANWDPRSLQLNFEFNLECYSQTFARQLETLIDDAIAHSRQCTWMDVGTRNWPVRLRDGVARLLTPYL